MKSFTKICSSSDCFIIKDLEDNYIVFYDSKRDVDELHARIVYDQLFMAIYDGLREGDPNASTHTVQDLTQILEQAKEWADTMLWMPVPAFFVETLHKRL